jgi:hypothetical protein
MFYDCTIVELHFDSPLQYGISLSVNWCCCFIKRLNAFLKKIYIIIIILLKHMA